ncbi:MAG TPA: DUF4335 domain-containing protein [Leptolyngbyaceae cyanobacterium]
MTIQRQYSLPNCTLVLEGLSDATTGSGQLDVRPVMSILVNAECHLAGSGPPLTGGREFFESLIAAVSNYAQEFLSGIPHSLDSHSESPLVQLRRIGTNLHRLIVQRRGDVSVASSNGLTGNTASSAPIELDLTTVQLFDLVEAIDQFVADSQTLPGLPVRIAPVERRFANSDQPIAKRAAPAAIGVSTVAVAALALFFVPVPQEQRPIKDEPLPQPTPGSVSTTPGASVPPTDNQPASPLPSATETPSPSSLGLENISPTPLATETPSPSSLGPENISPTPLATETPSSSLSPENISPTPLATETPSSSLVGESISPTPLATETPSSSLVGESISPTPLATETPAASTFASQTVTPSPAASELTTTSTIGTEIINPTQLEDLKWKLYNQINQAWQNRSQWDKNLVYRVTVNEDGAIVGYKSEDVAANAVVEQTPLPKLLVSPSVNPDAAKKPMADFKVVFSPQGVPEVSPWRGAVATTTPLGLEIVDAGILRDLNQQLHKQILDNKEAGVRFPEQLIYRVAMRPDGTIVDYEARNQTASDYLNQTPLPKLKSSISPTATTSPTNNQEPLAYFKVVFTPRGVPQVSPWRGFR